MNRNSLISLPLPVSASRLARGVLVEIIGRDGRAVLLGHASREACE